MKRAIDYSTYYDKVLGGWLGKSAGGILGAPIEGFKRFNDIELSEKLFETSYPNDDLDLQVLWLDMAKKLGPSIRSSDFGDFWKTHVDYPWNEYGIATRNLKLGVYPPNSGLHNNWYWKESMGCPIRSEIWGMLCPGMPEQAAFYAKMDASLDHEAFSVQAEMFLSACEAEAFFLSDPKEIIEKVLKLFKPDTPLFRLVSSILEWHSSCTYENAVAKIKAYWGDADFTSAPQNVGFAILVLLDSEGKFDSIMEALHLGHDSDCIAATVGATLGIINGYENISEQWKKLVGDELTVGPEITGINIVGSLSELAEEACKAGISFIKHFCLVDLQNCSVEAYETEAKSFHLEVELPGYEPGKLRQEQEIVFSLENLDMNQGSMDFKLELQSSDLIFSKKSIKVKKLKSEESAIFKSSFSLAPGAAKASSYIYQILVKSGGKQIGQLERGVPYYGEWLLAGPFIEDDPSIEAMDERYPDHGLSSMPGVNYMNHDKLSPDKEFVKEEELRLLASEKNFNQAPYLLQSVFPESFKIDLNKYFYGKGERSLYLYTKVESTEAIKKWLVLGSTAYYKVWVNGELKLNQAELSRSWPADKTIEADLKPGVNHILVRVDMPLDKAELEIGFKDFINRHPHQSPWDRQLIPFL